MKEEVHLPGRTDMQQMSHVQNRTTRSQLTHFIDKMNMTKCHISKFYKIYVKSFIRYTFKIELADKRIIYYDQL